MSPAEVFGEYRGTEAEYGIIPAKNSFIFRPKGRNCSNRAKDLLAIDPHVVTNITKHGGLDKEASTRIRMLPRPATNDNFRPLLLSGLDVLENSVALCLVYLRTLEGDGVEGIPER